MKIYPIETGNFKLDGGAMFGVVPKVIWNKLNPADENNLCSWSMRCMLAVDGERRILIDTGMGTKQSEKFFSHYHLHGEGELMKSLRKRWKRMTLLPRRRLWLFLFSGKLVGLQWPPPLLR